MSSAPQLTDRNALLLRRTRAARIGHADFIHRTVADEIEERLSEVNRRFTDGVTVSGFPELWSTLRPHDRQVTDSAVLDVGESSCDLLIHALALHWADDPVGQLIQSRRALRPDGLFLGCLFGGQTLNELRGALVAAEVAETGGLSPRVAPMAEIRELGSLLQRAGFALPVADSLPLQVVYRDIMHLIGDLRAMGETNALADRHRRPSRRSMFVRAAKSYAEAHALPDGRIPATFELVFLTGWAPSDSQPKPLRPGSASTRFADALGTREQPLPGKPSPAGN